MTTPGSEDDVVERLRAGDCSFGCSDADREEAIALIERLQKELMEARETIAWANNSLYGSHGFFLSLNGGPPNVHHIDSGIENLKEESRKYWRDTQEIRSKTIEECAKVAEGWEVEAGGGTYMTSGGARYWDGDHDYHQARMDAASDIRALNSNGGGKP